MIVVEGKEDTVAIRRAVDADTIETGGSAINEDVLRRIELAQARRGVIVLTDPDSPGERIRKIVEARVPSCKHAFLLKDEARGKDGIGVEHASNEAIIRALERVRSSGGSNATEAESAAAELEPEIEWSDLLDAGLIVHASASKRRERMGELLGIGYANGKQFYKRCVNFRITRQEFARALEQLEKEGI
ncbi:ribonuclease M5 [Cohnella sp. AR92]|uniref:ribonuclease M5 n=1 Tax=Cohnella sp. AR92 TaxID=648716 RepID=UPI000F8D2983|nr:ribonuclease M5 [Cohnella sp. AR92]RUS47516.1 ribonuclease M5 [Cohnella sp. AR92]